MMFPKKEITRSQAVYEKYKREHRFCELPLCHRPAFMGPHHIVFRSQGGSDSDENLIALCRGHHEAAHGVKSREIRQYLQELKENHENRKDEV